MEPVCPVCNGFRSIREIFCPYCGTLMEDKGKLDNFLGSYSPYEEGPLLTSSDALQSCFHLIACSKCGCDCRMPIPLVKF